MDQKEGQRGEVYERIPWEQLTTPAKDRQWLIVAIAGAVVVGALAYSFASNRTAPVTVVESVPASLGQAEPAVTTPAVPPPSAVPAPNPSPRVVTEADLYAIAPQTLMDQAAAHAEWVVREFLRADGSAEGNQTLRLLLPADVPLPSVGEGYLSFVEWTRAMSVTEIDTVTYRVEVLATYMVATEGNDYVRQPPEVFSFDVKVDDAGPLVVSAPTISDASIAANETLGLVDVPQPVMALVDQVRPGADIVGGRLLGNGQWEVVVLTVGPGGSTRPEVVLVEP